MKKETGKESKSKRTWVFEMKVNESKLQIWGRRERWRCCAAGRKKKTTVNRTGEGFFVRKFVYRCDCDTVGNGDDKLSVVDADGSVWG